MKQPSHPDNHTAAWLGGSTTHSRTDPLLSALDRLYAAGPDPAATSRAIDRLRRSLPDTSPRVAFYDRVPRTIVGDLFIAVTERGVMALEFTSSEAAFVRRLQARTRVRPERSSERTAEVARQVREFLSGERLRFDLPIDLSAASEFQRKVLLAAAEVPRGQVTTYAGLARRIGRPRAARAVGQALGHNPIPIILPCHRVLASDGSLGGYSAPDGVRTKARLLQIEGITGNPASESNGALRIG